MGFKASLGGSPSLKSWKKMEIDTFDIKNLINIPTFTLLRVSLVVKPFYYNNRRIDSP